MLFAKNNLLTIKQNLGVDYSVHFVESIFKFVNNNNLLSTLVKEKKLMVIVDDNVYKIYGDELEGFFKKICNSYLLHRFQATECNKNISSVERLCGIAKKYGMQKDSIFIGIGGGITLDVVGLSAFLYMRGVPYIRIPTTLIGFVDAGIGVKVSVNFNNSKNFFGNYYPPLAVFNDKSFLRTLTTREIRCGLYEIIKIAVIKDMALFELIEQHYKDFIEMRFNDQTEELNYHASYLLMQELESDLMESNRQRIVDFGHTFSQFIETSSKYVIPHGEAVGIDILISSFISLKKGLLSQEDFDRIFSLIKLIGFSDKYDLPKTKELHYSLDKIRQHRTDNLNLVLPLKIGNSVLSNQCSHEELDKAINFLQNTNLFNVLTLKKNKSIRDNNIPRNLKILETNINKF